MSNPKTETKSEAEIAQAFVKEYQLLCEKHGYHIVVVPAYKSRDDGTFSTILQTSVGKIKKEV